MSKIAAFFHALLCSAVLISVGCSSKEDTPSEGSPIMVDPGGAAGGGAAGIGGPNAGIGGPGSGVAGAGGCRPTTCEEQGKNCGPVADGCGDIIQCGTCEAPQTCGGGGQPSVCGGASACTPATCEALGKNCGPVADGCGDIIQCGDCTRAGDTCGGGGEASVCGQQQENPNNCAALLTCADHDVQCGMVSNGCGGLIECGTCPAGTTCGGGGDLGRCGAPTCTPLTCADYPADHCGLTPDGCGNVLTGCGVSCELPETCGGARVHNRCGYTPESACVPGTVASLCGPGACGPVSDGCGGTVNCGGCEDGNTCGGGGVASQCGGVLPCTPASCESLGKNCGYVSNGCGGVVQCGECTEEGDTCGGDGVANVCGQAPEDVDGCPALLTCADHNATCGTVSNGCGGTLECGDCELPLTCGGGGVPNRCGQAVCTPLTCAAYPAAYCGSTPDGCGGFLTGCDVVTVCPEGTTCGGGGTANRCGARPSSCVPDTRDTLCGTGACGPRADGCGGVVQCGGCTGVNTCGGGSVPGRCGAPECVPWTCEQMNAQCGILPNGCDNGSLNCGTCDAGTTCGGGGAPNQCGAPACSTLTCGDQNVACGSAGDGCGGTLASCGTCSNGLTCGGGGEPSQCGAPECTPQTCADVNANCGTIGDGCGGTEDCGPIDCGDVALFCGGGGPNRCGTEGTGGGGPGGPGDPNCTGLCQDQVYCPDGATTLTGTVYAPNGTIPLYNAMVYVPVNPDPAALPGISDGASCDRCDEEDLGNPLVSALSGANGQFELRNVPAGVDFPLVIKMGKWRRVVNMVALDACSTRSLSSELTRLPRNRTEGNIPKIAISTGRVDGLECVLHKAGVDTNEFTRPTGDGRIHLYRANTDRSSNGRGGAWPDEPARNCEGCGGLFASSCRSNWCGGSASSHQTATLASVHAARLYEDQSVLDGYDMAAFGCEASEASRSSGDRTRMRRYVDRGGRLFLSHYHYDWLHTTSPLRDTATAWDQNGFLFGVDGTTPARLDIGFPRGLAFSAWLSSQGASHNGDPEQINIVEPRTHVPSVTAAARRWVYTSAGEHDHNSVQHFTFNTPVHALEENQCGRVVYTAFHVTNGNHWDTVFPNHCSGPITAQEKALLFMFFDLAACVADDDTPPPPPPSCSPRSCGSACGVYSDGCGDTLNCPDCEDGFACIANQCVSGCTPRTCAQAGANCGWIADGCGGVVQCDDVPCPEGQICGGAGVPNQCGFEPCVPRTCESLGDDACGVIGSGCEGSLPVDCGGCPDGLVCGGGGLPNRCGVGDCDPQDCNDANATCGTVGDGCGGTVECGNCPPPSSCGGGGVRNQCGGNDCPLLTCLSEGAECGFIGDGCGGSEHCGNCPSGQVCGGDGIPNRCGTGCEPLSCSDLNANCGLIGNGCGGTAQCGTCPAGQTCGAGGQANRCGTGPACVPLSCSEVGADCGLIGDGCGGQLNCGTCPAGQICGGDGVANRCGGGCTERSCADVGAECGAIGDGCGGTIPSCGTCPPPTTCGGGGEPNRCGGNPCTRLTCADVGASCGLIGDGCGGALNCGSCATGQICGGGGVPNQCSDGCEPLTCVEAGAACGQIGNGCGGTRNCGSCPPGLTCGGGGVPNQCGKGPCTPLTCARMNAECGAIGDGCGGLVQCGDCPPPFTCGGGGVLYECGGCQPLTCAQVGAECGPIADGCGGLVDCGVCRPGFTCGLNGPNQCGGLG